MCFFKFCEGFIGCWLGFFYFNRIKYFFKGYKICIRYIVFKIEIFYFSFILCLLKKDFLYIKLNIIFLFVYIFM